MKIKVRYRKESFLYAIDLFGGFIYVGLTNDINRRIREHYEGKGAMFTKRFKPKGVRIIIPLGECTKAEACAAENVLTLELMLMYSQNKIRGGGYTALGRKLRSTAEMTRLLNYWKRVARTWQEYQKYGGFHPDQLHETTSFNN